MQFGDSSVSLNATTGNLKKRQPLRPSCDIRGCHANSKRCRAIVMSERLPQSLCSISPNYLEYEVVVDFRNIPLSYSARHRLGSIDESRKRNQKQKRALLE